MSDHPVMEKLKSLDLDQLTPMAALQKLSKFRQELVNPATGPKR